ncbi:MAG: hypothetical protein HRU31_04170 [Rhodobacteraceae bacterium]|nr:hypothetical protein [Paracoccaceae bacterium]
MQAIPGLPPIVSDLPKGCAFAARCDRANEVCFAARPQPIAKEGRSVRCFRPEISSLAQEAV